MASFEYTEQRREAFSSDEWRPVWGWWLAPDPALRSQIAESKLLIDRIRLTRDYAANKALIFDALEALEARDRDTPEGIERIRAAFLEAPPGKQYATRFDIHFSIAESIWRWKSDTARLDEALRQLYPPGAPSGSEPWSAAKLFAQKGRVTQADWEWIFAAHQRAYCGVCVRTLLQVPQHLGDGTPQEVRAARALQAVALIPNDRRKPASAYWELLGYGTPELALELEPRIPPELRAQSYTWKSIKEEVTRVHAKDASPELSQRLSRRGAEALAASAEVSCTSLAAEIGTIGFDPAVLALLDERTCSCLTGELRNQVSLVNRDDLLQHARRRKLACIEGLPHD
jgi:hypothetical protein